MPKNVEKKSNIWAKVGVWSYIVGMVIAFAMSFVPLQGWVIALLVVLGIIVGLLNIGDDEVQLFLLASVAFVVSSMALYSVFSGFGGFWEWLARLMNAVVVFTAPGALVVAFKALYHVAKSD